MQAKCINRNLPSKAAVLAAALMVLALVLALSPAALAETASKASSGSSTGKIDISGYSFCSGEKDPNLAPDGSWTPYKFEVFAKKGKQVDLVEGRDYTVQYYYEGEEMELCVGPFAAPDRPGYWGVQIEGAGNYFGHNSTDIFVRTWADSIYRYDVECASALANGKGVYYLPAAVSFCEAYGCLANYDVTLSGFTKKGVYKGAAASGFTVEYYASEDDYRNGNPAMTKDECKAAKSGEYCMVVKGDGEKLTGTLTTKVSVVPFKKGMYLYVKAGKNAWAEARLLSLAKGTVSIENLFAEPTYSAKTKQVYTVPSKLSYHGRTFKVTTLGYSIFSKASKAVVPSFISKINGSFSFNDDLKQATLGTGVESIVKGSFRESPKLTTVVIKGLKLNQACFKNMLYESSIKTIKLSGQSSSVKAKYRSWIRAASGGVRVI